MDGAEKDMCLPEPLCITREKYLEGQATLRSQFDNEKKEDQRSNTRDTIPVVASDIDKGDDVWMIKAACRGPQRKYFYPSYAFERKADRLERERRAKEICRTCSVLKQCLEYALSNQEKEGIWGGLNEIERKQLMSQRAS